MAQLVSLNKIKKNIPIGLLLIQINKSDCVKTAC